MKKEQLAAIILAVIIFGSLSAYLLVKYNDDIFGKDEADNIKDYAEVGDCLVLNYIGKFSNDTVFDTSYEDVAKEWDLYDESLVYEPVNIFVDPEGEFIPPEGYDNYSSMVMLKAVIEASEGMKEGETKTVTIQPEDGFGIWNETLAEEWGLDSTPLENTIETVVDQNRTEFETYFPDVDIAVDTVFDYGSIAIGVNNTLNATITDFNDTNIGYRLLPKNGTTFLVPVLNMNAIILVDNETSSSNFTMRYETEVGHEFTMNYYGLIIHFKVVGLNETDIKLAVNMEAPDVSFIGQTIVYELKVEKLYKTSSLLEES